jgi:hypothetical protein
VELHAFAAFSVPRAILVRADAILFDVRHATVMDVGRFMSFWTVTDGCNPPYDGFQVRPVQGKPRIKYELYIGVLKRR